MASHARVELHAVSREVHRSLHCVQGLRQDRCCRHDLSGGIPAGTIDTLVRDMPGTAAALYTVLPAGNAACGCRHCKIKKRPVVADQFY